MKTVFSLLLLFLLSFFAYAQKKALTHDVYDSWKGISERIITHDGKFAAYVLSPQEGDSKVVFYNLATGKTDSVNRGMNVQFTYGSDFAVFKIKPPLKATKDAKRAKKKKEDMPKDSLGIYSMNAGLVKIPNVFSYKIPEKEGNTLAYLQESPKTIAKKDTSKNAPKAKPPKKETEENGYKLVLRNLKSTSQQSFNFVTEYELPKNGKYLAFATTGNDSTMKSGVYVYDIARSSLSKIYESKGKYKKLSFSEDGSQLAFVADLDTNAKALVRYPKLMYWKAGEKLATILADTNKNPGPQGWLVSAEYKPVFAKDGSKLFFGTNPKSSIKDTTLLAEEIVSLDVWNYKDARLMPQQLVTAEQDKKKSFVAVANLSNNKMIQLGSKDIPDIDLVSEGNADFVVGASNLKYSNQHWDWNPTTDIYLISTKTGEIKQISQAARGNPDVSPTGKYVYWFSLADTSWFAYSVKTSKLIRLTNDKRFADEDDDHPDYPNSYGVAGWTKGDEKLWIYGKYDIYAVNPEKPNEITNLTNSRDKKLTYRYIKLDAEEKNIDASKPTILRFFDNTSKGSGYATYSEKGITELVKGNYTFSYGLVKAKNADNVLLTRSTFREFPDLYATDLSFKNLTKISDANPQQKNYFWGSVELVKWNTDDGIVLEGLLYKPEGFDANKKYPMLTYYYEKSSDGLYQYQDPSPSRSVINFSYYTSNGYVIFVPDIVYKIGYPGASAYNCVMPGIQSILDKGFIDKTRLGLQGHSWGGYQTAYIVTQTNMFRAVEAGAPVANMTSAYGGIRWGTGLARQAQYEHTQSRIGGTLWEKPLQFVENSPLFYLPKVQTPVLILHNDGDDAVPWYQGIELFLGLKRLNKPTWLLNYNGEKHGLMERKNRKDFTIRMAQYFDYYLKDAPMPLWMKEGVPATEKGINYGLGN